MKRITFSTVTGSLAFIWCGVIALVVQSPVFGQANYATPYTVTTIAGRAGYYASANGTNGSARFQFPSGVAVDGATNVYVADVDANTIRKVTPVGTNWVVTTIAGLAGITGSANGTGSAARFNQPQQVALDSAGNIYVADVLNYTIRKVTPVGTNWVVTTIAGRALYVGSAEGTNGAARFNDPVGVAVDSATNVYVAEYENDTIRKVTPAGTNWVVTTLAGLALHAGSLDGTGSAARFNGPYSVAVDNATNVYVGDFHNDTIREVTQDGTNWVVTTLAGLALHSGSADGTGSAARFNEPTALAVDSAGIVYVADGNNDTIRKGSPPLVITSSGPSFGFSSSRFSFALNGLGGQTVIVDGSSDLENWLPIWTNTLTFPAPISFSDAEAGSNSIRFYRARTP
jgi:hypothetical protein